MILGCAMNSITVEYIKSEPKILTSDLLIHFHVILNLWPYQPIQGRTCPSRVWLGTHHFLQVHPTLDPPPLHTSNKDINIKLSQDFTEGQTRSSITSRMTLSPHVSG